MGGLLRGTASVFLGAGPPLALVLAFVGRRSLLLIITVVAAFFWLLAALVASLVWTAVQEPTGAGGLHLVTLTISVLAQEAARWVFCRFFRRAERGLFEFLPPEHLKGFNDLTAAVASGLGFGLMHIAVMYGAILVESFQDGALYTEGCHSALTVYHIAAIESMYLLVLHVALMVVSFDGFRRSSWRLAGLVAAARLGFSMLSLGHDPHGRGGSASAPFEAGSNACSWVLPLQAALLLVVSAGAVMVVQRLARGLRRRS